MYAIQPSFALVRITHRMITLLGLMERYWYYLGIMVMFGIGWVWPSTGLWMRAIGITPYLVAFAFFMNGFALSSESLLDSMKQWRVLCCALIISFAISPALVLAIRCLVPGCNTLLGEGFQIVSLVPTLFVSTVVLTRIAKGNAAVALYLTVTSNLLAIIIAPLLIRATLGASGSQLNLSATSISMIFTVLFPTILGQVARKRWEVWAERRAGFVTIISQCTILIFIVTGVSSLPRSVISTSMAITAIIGGLVLHAVLISIGRLGGIVIRAGEPERRALTFCSAQKSFVFNVLLCEHLFAGNRTAFGLAILPGIIYYLLVLTIDSIIAQWWSMHPLTTEGMRIKAPVGYIELNTNQRCYFEKTGACRTDSN